MSEDPKDKPDAWYVMCGWLGKKSFEWPMGKLQMVIRHNDLRVARERIDGQMKDNEVSLDSFKETVRAYAKDFLKKGEEYDEQRRI